LVTVTSRPRIAASALLLAVVLARSAHALTTSAVVPIVLSSGGLNGSRYTSELTLTNRGAKDSSVTLAYTAAFGGGSGSANYLLPAGLQRVYPDAIGFLRAIGVPIPTTDALGGTLAITFAGVDSPAEVSATVRTTTAVPDGRAGLAYAGVPPADALTGAVVIAGLRQNAEDRSNVALVNLGAPADGPVHLRVTVFSGDTGAVVKVLESDVAPGGFFQYSEILGAVPNGWVRVERTSGSAPYDAYGVVNDNANSDGSFVPALRPETLSGRTSLTLPVVVEAGKFTSELVLTNTGAAPRTVHLVWVAAGLGGDGSARQDLTLAAGAQAILPSYAQYLRDHGAAGVPAAGGTLAGALFATADGGDVSGLALGARTSAAGGVSGRYGLFYTATPAGLALTDSAWLYDLQQNAENRANLALVNTGESDGGADAFRLEIFDGANGHLAATVNDLAVPARGWRQINTVLSAYAPGVSSGYARVTKTSGANPFLTYAVVNDGADSSSRSGDGAFVAPDRGCVYVVTPVVDAVVAGGGAGTSITVDAPAGCFWTTSSDASFLAVTSAASGAGSGTVSYTAASNDGAARSGTLTVAGRRITVSQAGAGGGCSYTLSSPSDSVEATSGTGSVSVSTSSGCAWTAVSNDGWIHVIGGASGSGPGTVSYSFDRNGGSSRSGTLTVAGLTYTIVQAEPNPVY
jgi:hypothetical protein